MMARFVQVYALKAMAKKGVNVIMVLHQPSYPLYQMFTNALLLGKGGRTVFLGKSEDALQYFTHIG
jgi:ABC-type hemin transport system ATPase subunit